MSILTDGEIRLFIAQNQLVINGDPTRAVQCSYEFTVAKIFPSGTDSQPIDWSNPPADASFTFKPGSLVWVRMSHRVKLPLNLCAFWWQTNRLSRKGLMLVNMSIVEPGYDGPLACLFVNFGKDVVRIDPSIPVAKLVFMRMENAVATPLNMTLETVKYDADLHEVALAAPLSFLNVSELSRNLELEYQNRLNNLRTAKSQLEDEIRKSASEVRQVQKEEMQNDLESLVRRSFFTAFAALLLLAVASQFVPILQSYVRPNLDEAIAKAVDEQLNKRIMIAAHPLVPGVQNNVAVAPIEKPLPTK